MNLNLCSRQPGKKKKKKGCALSLRDFPRFSIFVFCSNNQVIVEAALNS